MRLPAFLRQFRTAADVERAIARELWLGTPGDGVVRQAFRINRSSDGTFLVALAPGVSWRAVTRQAGRLLSEESAEVLVRARLTLAFKDRGATFAGVSQDVG